MAAITLKRENIDKLKEAGLNDTQIDRIKQNAVSEEAANAVAEIALDLKTKGGLSEVAIRNMAIGTKAAAIVKAIHEHLDIWREVTFLFRSDPADIRTHDKAHRFDGNDIAKMAIDAETAKEILDLAAKARKATEAQEGFKTSFTQITAQTQPPETAATVAKSPAARDRG